MVLVNSTSFYQRKVSENLVFPRIIPVIPFLLQKFPAEFDVGINV